MTFDLFRTFHHVERLKSFTKAAKHMDTTQPNVSYRIRKLERLLGKKLFIRGNPIKTTYYGEILAFKFLPLMIQYESMEKSLVKEVKHAKNQLVD